MASGSLGCDLLNLIGIDMITEVYESAPFGSMLQGY